MEAPEHWSSDNFLLWKKFVFSKMRVESSPGKWVPYEPYGWQRDLHFKPFRFGAAMIGRRAGKTLAAGAEIVALAGMPGQMIWVGAPIYELTDRVFKVVHEQIVKRKIFGGDIIHSSSFTRNLRRIELTNGTLIEGRSAEGTNVGEGIDLAVVDEAARCPRSLWTEELQPSTVNRDGRGLLISTPRGFDWFSDLHDRGGDPEDKNWTSWHGTTLDNPYIDDERILSIKEEISEEEWNQEYLAIPQEFSGLVYPQYVDKLRSKGGHLFKLEDIEPGNMTNYRAIDIGLNHLTVCLWGAVEQGTNDLYIYDRYGRRGLVQEDHADTIAGLQPYRISTTWISHDASRRSNQRTTAGEETVADVYRKRGIPTRPAIRDQGVGINAVRRYLAATMQESPDHPKMFIADHLRDVRMGLKRYVFGENRSDPLRGKETPKKVDDDDMDALRYMCVHRPRFLVNQFLQERIEPTVQRQEGWNRRVSGLSARIPGVTQ